MALWAPLMPRIHRLSSISASQDTPQTKAGRATRTLDATATHELCDLLDRLNSMAYPLPGIPSEEALNLIHILCTIVPPAHEETAGRFSLLVASLVSRQPLTLPQTHLDCLIEFLLDSLVASRGAFFPIEALRGISAVVMDNGARLVKYHARILDLLLPLSRTSNVDLESRRMAVNCIGNLCSRTGAKLASHYPTIFTTLLRGLVQYVEQSLQHDVSVYRLLSSTLRGLQLVMGESKDVHAPHVHTLVGLLQQLFTLGTPGGTIALRTATALVEGVPQPDPWKSPRVAQHGSEGEDAGRRSSGWVSQSDGGSGGEGPLGSRVQLGAAKVRFNALQCLQAMARAQPRLLHPEWNVLLPSFSSSAYSQTTNTVGVMLHDPSPKVRAAAGSAVCALFDNSRNFLSMASLPAPSSPSAASQSFIPLSHVLGHTVVQLFKQLGQALEEESDPAATVQILKAVGALVLNAPHGNVGSGHIHALSQQLRPLYTNPDATVRSASFVCTAALLGTNTPLDEAQSLLVNEPSPLLPLLLAALDDPTGPDVREDVLSVLTAAAHGYNAVVRRNWDNLSTHLLRFYEGDDRIRTASAKLLEELCRGASTDDQEEETQTLEVLPWEDLLGRHAAPLTSDPIPAVAACAINAMSSVPPHIFAELPGRLRMMCFTTALASVSDDSHVAVRASACRALGVFVLMTSDDQLFIEDAVRILCPASRDSSALVRMRAVWSLGNVCEAMRNAADSSWPPISLRISVGQCALQAVSETDKIRSNAIRALGNLCRAMTASAMESPQVRKLVHQSAVEISRFTQTGAAKVRWNACHAAGHLLGNLDVLKVGVVDQETDWPTLMFASLVNVLIKCDNFKVRIGAAQSLVLVHPHARESFGESFKDILAALLNGWERVEMGVDVTEYKYKTTLQAALLKALVYIVSLGKKRDYSDLKGLLVANAELLLDLLDKAQASEDGRIVDAAYKALAAMYESQMKTIPVALLQQYQEKARSGE